MAAPVLYCTLADVLALVSADAQARLATDQGAVPIGTGDGLTATFDTPFQLSSAIKTSVAGADTPNTLVPGGAANGNDQVTFSSAPDSGALITAQANVGAVNVSIVQQCIELATNEIKRYLSRYGTEALPDDCLAMVKSPTVFYARWFLRERRNQNDYPPILAQKKTVDDWLMAVATGKIALPASAPIATAAQPTSPMAVIAEPSVFEPPYGSGPGLGSGWWW